MDSKKYGIERDHRGELYFFIHQQLFSRYYLERLSNGFGQIPALDFEVPVETPYYPSLQYPCGLPFPERPRFAKLSDYFYNYGQKIASRFAYSYTFYKDYSRRIADCIDRGYALNVSNEPNVIHKSHKTQFIKYGNEKKIEFSDLSSLGNLNISRKLNWADAIARNVFLMIGAYKGI